MFGWSRVLQLQQCGMRLGHGLIEEIKSVLQLISHRLHSILQASDLSKMIKGLVKMDKLEVPCIQFNK